MFASIWRILPALALGCSLLTASDLSARKNDKSSSVTGYKTRQMKSSKEQNQNGMKKRPCAVPRCPNTGFFVEGDFLYWRAENHGFSYAFDTTFLNTQSRQSGDLKRVSPNWDPGFRVGLGWNTPFDYWDVFANWTYYHNKASAADTRSDLTLGSGVGLGLHPLYPQGFTNLIGPYQSDTASFKLNYNTLDVELGRLFPVSKRLSVRLHAGARFGWIYQNFRSRFFGLINTAAGNPDEIKFLGRNQSWGGGPRLGLSTRWHVGGGVRVVGLGSTSLLYGKNKMIFHSYATRSIAGLTEPELNTEDSFDQLTPTAQLGLGLEWGMCFNKDKMAFSARLMWETNYWWNQFQLPIWFVSGAPSPTIGNQPLTAEGISLNVAFDF